METITSKSNAKIIEAKKLLDKKYRDKFGLFLIETEKCVLEALNCKLTPKYFFVQENKRFEVINKYLQQSSHKDVKAYSVSQNVFKEISNVVSPDGVVAVFEKPLLKKEYLGGNFLVLDNLQNPDNFGSILRTAAACNFKQIFAINSVDEYNSKVIRSSMGNQFKLNIVHINYDDIEILFKNATLFAMDMNGKNMFEVEKFDKNLGFVIGNEGNGISNEIKSKVKNTLSIPMQNNVESLNASISASVVMYYIFSKNLR